jgi:hypothetical protein
MSVTGASGTPALKLVSRVMLPEPSRPVLPDEKAESWALRICV